MVVVTLPLPPVTPRLSAGVLGLSADGESAELTTNVPLLTIDGIARGEGEEEEACAGGCEMGVGLGEEEGAGLCDRGTVNLTPGFFTGGDGSLAWSSSVNRHLTLCMVLALFVC